MLRQRKINTKLFCHFEQSLKFNSGRNVHVTSSCFLRKAPSSPKRYPEIKPLPAETTVAGKFVAQPLKSTFTNFYGIESDEGVMHITSKPAASKSSQDVFLNKFSSKKLGERFTKTSFGKLRLDNENKVILHGQFEENNSVYDLFEKSKASQIQNFSNESSDKSSNSQIEKAHIFKVKNQDSDLNMKCESEVSSKTSDTDGSKSQSIEETNNSSFIDELYFSNEYVPHEKKITVEDLPVNTKNTNYIEESYFLNNEAEQKFSETTSSKNKSSYEMHESSLDEISENLNNIKASQFKPTQSIIPEKNKFTSTINQNEDAKIIKENTERAGYNTEERSFIEQHFFGESEIGSPETYTQHLNEVFGSTKSISFDNIAENNKNVIGNKKESTESVSKHTFENMESNTDNLNKNTNIEFFHSKTHSIKSCDLNRHSIKSCDLNRHSTNSAVVTSSTKVNKFAYKDALKESLNSNISPEITASVNVTQVQSNVKINEATQQTKLISKVNTNMPSVQENIEEEPVTAFDFVKKLRGGKKVTYHEAVNGLANSPGEKLDSKGFRILKHQVPELKYFTRDEMLELLLKNVLYSDEDVVVLNKPYNLIMHDSKTAKDACLSNYLDDFAGMLDSTSKNPKLLTVHRLDKETTGCLLLARNDLSAQKLKTLFAQRKIIKTYWIVTIRVPDPLQGVIDIPISEGYINKKSRMVLHPDLPKDIAYRNHSKRGKNAVTHYNVVSESGNAALVEVKPETGIKHQIRVHFGLGLSCPILGDHKYSYADKLVPQKLPSDFLQRLRVQQSKVRHIPMHIYARSIFIPQYTTGRNLFVVAPMPSHMSKNLQKLKFRKN